MSADERVHLLTVVSNSYLHTRFTKDFKSYFSLSVLWACVAIIFYFTIFTLYISFEQRKGSFYIPWCHTNVCICLAWGKSRKCVASCDIFVNPLSIVPSPPIHTLTLPHDHLYFSSLRVSRDSSYKTNFSFSFHKTATISFLSHEPSLLSSQNPAPAWSSYHIFLCCILSSFLSFLPLLIHTLSQLADHYRAPHTSSRDTRQRKRAHPSLILDIYT